MSDKKTGRPTSYTKDKADEICRMIENGLTLNSISKLDGMPEISTIYNWQDAHPEFMETYARARARKADTIADMIQEEAFNAHDAQIGRLRIDALKWTASKLAPKKYGDKVEIEQTGQQNFKISFNVPERENAPLHAPVPLEALPAATPQIIDISPESIPDSTDLPYSDDITPDRE